MLNYCFKLTKTLIRHIVVAAAVEFKLQEFKY